MKETSKTDVLAQDKKYVSADIVAILSAKKSLTYLNCFRTTDHGARTKISLVLRVAAGVLNWTPS